MCQLLETIKVKNAKIHLAELHQQRMNRSCKDLFDTQAPDLLEALKSIHIPDNEWYKIRVVYSKYIDSITLEKYQPRSIQTLKIVEENEIDYPYKFKDRIFFDQIINQKGNADEVVVLKNGRITDASYANLIFFDGKQWDTPITPLLKGVQRQYLLAQGTIYEKEIKESTLKKYEKVALINAMLNFDDKIEVGIDRLIF